MTTPIDATLLDAAGKPLDLTLGKMQSDIKRLYERGNMQLITSFAALGISDTEATVALVASRLPNNAIFMTEVYRGTQTNFDMPTLQNGATQSGRLTVWASSEVTNKVTFNFQDEYGLWIRHINRSTVTQYIDTGWHKVMQHGIIEFFTASSASNNGNLMSNIKTPGRYYVSGALMSTFTDTPTTGSGASVLDVEYLLDLGDTIQTLRTNGAAQTGWRRHISTTGTVGAWVQEFVGNSTINSTAAFNFAGGTMSGTISSQHIQPRITNTYDLGTASLTFRNIYSQNAVTVVSDRNLKEQHADIPDNVLDAWATVNYSQWKLKSAIAEKGEEAARLHVGIVAQEIKEKFEAAGLDATKYGILIYDSWDAIEAVEHQPAKYDLETEELISEEVLAVEGREAGEIWMVRMEECLAMEAALMRRTQKKLEERLAALEAK